MTIILTETFRAVFYAPFYAAHALGAYADEGVDVRLQTPEYTEAAGGGLLSSDSDVSWGGPMRVLVGRDRNSDSDLVGFCEVVTRDPFFLVGRAPKPDFNLSDLAGLRFGTVSEVPTPWMCLQDDIRGAGLEPASLDRVTDRTMADNAAALRDGALDVVQLFEPFVEQLVREGAGHIWSAAATRGPTSYTHLFTTKRIFDEKHDDMLAMTRAIYRTQTWLHGQDAATIGAMIADFFPDLNIDILAGCIARYKDLGIWGRNPLLPKTGFDRLKAACLSGGLIEHGADYDDCVDTSLARTVMESGSPLIC